MPVKFREVFFFASFHLHFFLLCSFQGARGSLWLPEGCTLKTEQCIPDGSTREETSFSVLLRKEVTQPHLPIRLPCYDFTPVTAPAFDRFDSGFGRERLPWCDGRCVQGPGTYSPQYADLRLLAIPTSCRRVAACNPNWGMLSGFRSGSLLRFPLSIPL